MMLEYQDGHVSEPEPFPDALRRLKRDLASAKALHLGTREELTRQRRRLMERTEAALEARITRLEEHMAALTPLRSEHLHLPTPDEITEFGE